MKVLILSITAGQGHHAAAQSIAGAFTDIGAQVETIDVYKMLSQFLYKGIDKGYLLTTKYVPRTYSHVYRFLENKGQSSEYSIGKLVNVLLANKFDQYIESFAPNAIICTHIFSAQIVNELKALGKYVNIPTIGIVTDYTIHPFWEDIPHIEYINLANKLLSYKAMQRGIVSSRICSFGIPIQKKFNSSISKEEARKQLELNVNKKTILVMAGSMGYGNMSSIIQEIESLNMDLQILAVCGNNHKQYKKLTENNTSASVKVFGFTDKVDILMDAADCIITKPGGLTTTEAMAKHLPMILANPIPGQEERNSDFLLNNGIALAVNKDFSIGEALYFLFESPGHLEMMVERLKQVSTADAGAKLAEFTYNLINDKQKIPELK